MLIPFLKYQLIIAQAIEWDKKVRKIKTQRLKSESSGDWQKEKDQTPKKKERLQKKPLKKRKFKKKESLKKKSSKKREFKKETPQKRKSLKKRV